MTTDTLSPKPQLVDALVAEAHALRHSNTRRALALSEQAAALALKLDYQRGLARSRYLTQLCHYILADSEEVLTEALQVLGLFQSLGDDAGEADAHNLIAIAYNRRGDPVRTLTHYHHALEIHRRRADLASQAGMLNNIGMTHLGQARHADALEHLLHSLELAERAHSDINRAYVLGNLVRVYAEMGDLTQALEFFERSRALLHGSNDRALEASLLASLSRVYSQRGEHAMASEYLRQSLALARLVGNRGDEIEALVRLGRTQHDLGQLPEAEATLLEALDLIRQAGDRPLEAEALNALGPLCLTQQDWAGALRHGQALLALAEALPSQQLVGNAHRLLAQAREQLGDYQPALAHERAAHAAWQAVHGGEAGRRLRALATGSAVAQARREAETHRQRSLELEQALQALQDADEQKAALVRQLEAQTQLLQQLAHEDGLTGIANRRWLDVRLAQEFERAQRFAHPLAVALVDLDNFKAINDRLSHQVGDRVLERVARLLRDGCRSVDVAGRYGGEEFMLILVETALPQALVICQRLCEEVAAHRWAEVHPGLGRVTVSIGLSASEDAPSPEAMLARADARLYQAKHGGKNQACAADPVTPDGAEAAAG